MPNIQEYVSSCREQGFSDLEIRAGLVRSGWEASAIETAMSGTDDSQAPVQAAIDTAQRKPRRTVMVPVALSALALVAISGSTVAFAERGYLPAVSKIYRATPLPLLWHGTTANSDIAVGKMLIAASQNPGAETIGSFGVSVKKSAGEGKVSFAKSPLLAAVLKPKQPTELADIASGGAGGGLSNFSPDTLLPANISFTSTSAHDPAGNLKLLFGIDLGDLAAKLAPLSEQYAKTAIPQKTTVDGLLIHTAKEAYLRSNLIPYLTAADTNKWLSFDVPEDVLKSLDKAQTSPRQYDEKSLVPYREMLKKTLKDDGIVRRDGEALAKYEIALNPKVLRDLATDPALSGQAAGLKAAADSNTSLLITLFAEPQTARLRFIEIAGGVTPTGMGVDVSVSLKEEVRYQISEAIVAPPKDQTLTQPGLQYLQQISDGLIGNADSGSKP